MSNTEKIQIITIIIQSAGVLIALFTGVISIIMSVIAVKRTEKAERARSRAYIGAYVDTFDFGRNIHYLKIRNFGKSPAVINCVNYPEEIKTLEEFGISSGLDRLKNITVLPGQTIAFPFLPDSLPVYPIELIFKYESMGEQYSDTSTIDKDIAKRFVSFRTECKEDDKTIFEKNISYSLQEIAERISDI